MRRRAPCGARVGGLGPGRIGRACRWGCSPVRRREAASAHPREHPRREAEVEGRISSARPPAASDAWRGCWFGACAGAEDRGPVGGWVGCESAEYRDERGGGAEECGDEAPGDLEELALGGGEFVAERSVFGGQSFDGGGECRDLGGQRLERVRLVVEVFDGFAEHGDL